MDGAEHPLVKIQRMAAADKKAPLESEVPSQLERGLHQRLEIPW